MRDAFALTQASRERFGIPRADVEAGLRATGASCSDICQPNRTPTWRQDMNSVGLAIGVVVGRPADPLVRIAEVLLPLATTEELSTPLTGGRA